MDEKLREYYEYLRSKGASVPDSYERFKKVLSNDDKRSEYFDYLQAHPEFNPPPNKEVWDKVVLGSPVKKKKDGGKGSSVGSKGQDKQESIAGPEGGSTLQFKTEDSNSDSGGRQNYSGGDWGDEYLDTREKKTRELIEKKWERRKEALSERKKAIEDNIKQGTVIEALPMPQESESPYGVGVADNTSMQVSPPVTFQARELTPEDEVLLQAEEKDIEKKLNINKYDKILIDTETNEPVIFENNDDYIKFIAEAYSSGEIGKYVPAEQYKKVSPYSAGQIGLDVELEDIERWRAEGNKPGQGWYQNYANAFLKAAMSGAGDVVDWLEIVSNKVGSSVGIEKEGRILGIGEAIKEEAQKLFPDDPDKQRSFYTKIFQGAGSSVPFILAAVASGGASAWTQIAITGAMGGMQNGAALYREALEAGADPEQAWWALLNGTVIGGTEAFPIVDILQRADKVMGGALKKVVLPNLIKNIALGSAEEATQEFIQGIANNMTAQQLYDFSRELMDGVWENAAIGGIVGGIFSAAVQNMDGRTEEERRMLAEAYSNFKAMQENTAKNLQEQGEKIAKAIKEKDSPEAEAKKQELLNLIEEKEKQAREEQKKNKKPASSEEEEQGSETMGAFGTEEEMQPDKQDESVRMDDLVGKKVEYNGVKGKLNSSEDGYYVEDKDGNKEFIESGESGKSPDELGIKYNEAEIKGPTVETDFENNKVKLRGKEYEFVSENTDKDGNTVSVTLKNKDGKEVTVRDKDAVDQIVYEKTLFEGNFNNTTKEDIDETAKELGIKESSGEVQDEGQDKNTSGVKEETKTEPTAGEQEEGVTPAEEYVQPAAENDKANEEKKSDEPLKLAEDEKENEILVSKLAEEDNPKQEPSITAIESKAESNDKATLNEVVEEVDSKLDEATGVRMKKVSEISTDNSRFQNRDKLNEKKVENIKENWRYSKQDPIVIWKDKDGKHYVISGHHRLEAAKRAGLDKVKVEDVTSEYDEAGAIIFAREEANRNRSQETPSESSKIYRSRREAGQSKKQVMDRAKELEGANARYIVNLSYLNPNGKTMKLVKDAEEMTDKSQTSAVQRISDWIGEARSKNPNLTDAHENEMFDFLMDRSASARIKTKAEFLSKVSSLSETLDFDPSKPLNIKRFKHKTEGEELYEKERDEIKGRIAAVEGRIKELRDRFDNPASDGYIAPDSTEYAELWGVAKEKIAALETELKAERAALLKLQQEKGKYVSKGSIDLFSTEETKDDVTVNKQPKVDTWLARVFNEIKKIAGITGEKASDLTKAIDVIRGNIAKRMGITKEEYSKRITMRTVDDIATEADKSVKEVMDQGDRGVIIKSPDKTKILFSRKNADPTTPLHEMAHEYERVLTKDEIRELEAWSGHKHGTEEFSEAFAKGLERFIYEGTSGNKRVDPIFARIAKWIQDVINSVADYFGDINELNDAVKDIYSAMLTNHPDIAAMSEKTKARVEEANNDLDVEIRRQESKDGTPKHVTEARIKGALYEYARALRDSGVETFQEFKDRVPEKVIEALSKEDIENAWVLSKEPPTGDIIDDDSYSKRLKRFMDKVNKKYSKITESGVKKGKEIGPEARRKINIIKGLMATGNELQIWRAIDDLWNMIEGAESEAEINKLLDSIEAHTIALQALDRAQLSKAEAKLDVILDGGRTELREKLARDRADVKEAINGTVKVSTKGKGIKRGMERARLKEKKRSKIRRGIDTVASLFNKIERIRTLLDIIDRGAREKNNWGGFLDKEIYDPISRSRRNEDMFTVIVANKNKAKLKEIYGTKNMRAIRNKLELNSVPHDLGEFESGTESGKKIKLRLSQNQAYRIYQLMKNPKHVETLTKMGWTTDMVDAVMEFLSPEAKAWADYQVDELYPFIYKIVAPVYLDINNIELPNIPMYVPVVREGMDEGLLREMDENDSRYLQIMYSALKSRRDNNIAFDLSVDGDALLYQHMARMIHYAAFGKIVKKLSAVFSNSNVREAIRQNNPESILGELDNAINGIAKQGMQNEQTIKLIDKLRKWTTLSSLALAPTVFVKQLSSWPAYLAEVPVVDFMKGMGYALSHPKKALKIMNSSDYIKLRLERGMDRDVAEAMMRDYRDAFANAGNIRSLLMVMVKWGDIGAIYFGGYSVYHYQYNKLKGELGHKEAHKEALRQFEEATKLSQQSNNPEDLGSIQRAGSIAKLFTIYKTSPISYFQMERKAIRDFIRGNNRKNALKRLMIYHFVLPMIFEYVASGFPGLLSDWDDDDEKDLLRAGILGSSNGVFILADVFGYVADKAGGKPWARDLDPSLTPVFAPTVKAMWSGWEVGNALINGDPQELLEASRDLIVAGSDLVGIPATRSTKLYDNYQIIMGKQYPGVPLREKIGLGIGYSPYVILGNNYKKYPVELTKEILEGLDDKGIVIGPPSPTKEVPDELYLTYRDIYNKMLADELKAKWPYIKDLPKDDIKKFIRDIRDGVRDRARLEANQFSTKQKQK